MHRRQFLASTGVALASLGGRGAASALSWPRQREFSLTAAPCRQALLPGIMTDLWGFNHRVPGPVLEAMEGEEVVVRFRNDLPEPTTVHWHGIHLPFLADGSPFHPVAPGEGYEYRFTPPRGSAGTYWYHPHPHHRAGHQVAMGLAGALIVRDPEDPLRHLPERLLFLSDQRLDPEGRVDLPSLRTTPGRIDFENGREGPLLLVNGEPHPTCVVASGAVERWRIVNASAARTYRLALEGHALIHVGGDGGLFGRPVEVPELLLAPSERAEVLVRVALQPGERARLRSLPYDRYIPQTRPADWEVPGELLTVACAGTAPVAPVEVPARLRPVPPLDAAAATATRVIALSQGMINGRRMDPDRVDISAPLGATEVWDVENLVGMDHPFHLHGFPFQVLDRNGVPEPFRQWKDTVNVPRHERVRFVVRYDDHPGKWMFHCHILDHEDHGMMGILEVR
jgi:bilirubin oxidase